jgi:hypothetical protein
LIISRLQYGLGNQLFQYAVGKRLALETGRPLRLDLSWFEKHQYRKGSEETKRSFLLDHYHLDCDVIPYMELRKHLPLHGFLKGKALRFYKHYFQSHFLNKGNLELWKFSGDSKAIIKAAKHLTSRSIYVVGLHLDHRIIEPVRHELITELKLRDTPSIHQRTLAKIQNKNSVFVHVRRGDFITKRKDELDVCDLEYYKRAIKLVKDKIHDPYFIYFTDDPEYIQQNFDLSNGFLSVGNMDAPHLDLELMRSCKHGIMSNSTFSWWGAFLIENELKIIICPARWNKKDKKMGENLIPENWIKI